MKKYIQTQFWKSVLCYVPFHSHDTCNDWNTLNFLETNIIFKKMTTKHFFQGFNTKCLTKSVDFEVLIQKIFVFLLHFKASTVYPCDRCVLNCMNVSARLFLFSLPAFFVSLVIKWRPSFPVQLGPFKPKPAGGRDKHCDRCKSNKT